MRENRRIVVRHERHSLWHSLRHTPRHTPRHSLHLLPINSIHTLRLIERVLHALHTLCLLHLLLHLLYILTLLSRRKPHIGNIHRHHLHLLLMIQLLSLLLNQRHILPQTLRELHERVILLKSLKLLLILHLIHLDWLHVVIRLVLLLLGGILPILRYLESWGESLEILSHLDTL